MLMFLVANYFFQIAFGLNHSKTVGFKLVSLQSSHSFIKLCCGANGLPVDIESIYNFNIFVKPAAETKVTITTLSPDRRSTIFSYEHNGLKCHNAFKKVYVV